LILAKYRESGLVDELPPAYLVTELERHDLFSTQLFESALKILKEKATRRKILQLASDIENEVVREDEVSKVLAQLEQSLYDLEKKAFEDKTERISTVTQRLFEEIEKKAQNDSLITGVPSGFYQIDKMTAGFQPGELIVVGARPAMGKTAFATSIALNAADQGYKVGFISLEMPKEQIALRMLSNISGIRLYALRTGLLSPEQKSLAEEKAVELMQKEIYINDKAGMKISELRAYAKKMRREYGIDILFLDYLQLVSADKFLESKERETAEVSRTLKALAIELNIPVITLAQLNRTVEMRADKRPQLADLRNSGQIEQDADLVMFIHRPEYYKKNPTPEEEGLAEIIIAKQRNGPTDIVRLAFIKDITRFENLAKTSVPELQENREEEDVKIEDDLSLENLELLTDEDIAEL
ncbi:replicative DNA helicase, partial [Persephonella sp.]